MKVTRFIQIVTRGELRQGAAHLITDSIAVHTLSIDHPCELRRLRGRTVATTYLDGVTEEELQQVLPEHYQALQNDMVTLGGSFEDLRVLEV